MLSKYNTALLIKKIIYYSVINPVQRSLRVALFYISIVSIFCQNMLTVKYPSQCL